MKKLLFASLLFTPILGYSASFDCGKATTWVEKSICKNKQLSKLDEKMSFAFQKKLAENKKLGINDDFVKQEQRQWLQYHRNTCKTVACLKREYKEYLKLVQDKPLKYNYVVAIERNVLPLSSDKFGKFQDKTEISVYQGEKEGWQKTKTINELNLIETVGMGTEKSTNHIASLDANLIFTNAHECTMFGEQAYWSENHWKWVDFDKEDGCELRIYPLKNTVLLQDINNQCRKTLCGARAGFDGIILKKTD